MTNDNRHFILTIVCPDRKGIVAAVTRFLYERECNIAESTQFGDPETNKFFLRILFATENGETLHTLRADFQTIAAEFRMDASFHDAEAKTRTLIMVSKFDHCLVDLMYRCSIGALPIGVTSIVSNHEDFADVAASHRVPFHYLPVTKENKAAQERALVEIIETEHIELVVLARYMQIFSQDLAARLRGRVINIHHSFLPSFKGAGPYQQAHRRGVKLIGATAHYVTEQLDEGPIIEQGVERVTHSHSPKELTAIGRDIEASVLARAVKWHAEHRILLNGERTVVLR